MYIWTKAKVKIKDVGILLALTGGVAAIMGVAGMFFVPIALGAIAMMLSSGAIWLMTAALEKFQSLNWSKDNSDNLTYSIKSVLGALTGTSSEKIICTKS